jgi:glucan-binding YG repeat protein
MATGFTDVGDGYKRYFDEFGHMLVGWQSIGGKTYYFRASGAMQTGKATINGATYEFSASGTLKSGNPPALAAQDEGAIELG